MHSCKRSGEVSDKLAVTLARLLVVPPRPRLVLGIEEDRDGVVLPPIVGLTSLQLSVRWRHFVPGIVELVYVVRSTLVLDSASTGCR